MVDRVVACIIADYIETLSEMVNHNRVLEKLEEQGYTEVEVDRALRELGAIAGRDIGIL